jgi:hypothetical protein
MATAASADSRSYLAKPDNVYTIYTCLKEQ